MKKRILTAALIALGFFKTQAQETPKRKLTFEEANFVSSYYLQKGNNAAVTGGIGSEKLTDIAGGFNVSFSLLDKKERKNTFLLDAAIEKYTSASSDMIDPSTVSSASSSDVHFYPSLYWSRKNEKSGNTFGLNTTYSTEYDYKSYGLGGFYTKNWAEKNTEFTARLNLFFDQWKVILPAELRPEGYPTGAEGDSQGIPFKARNSYNTSFSFSKIINPNLQVLFMVDPSFQEGLLSTPFHRVYFNDNSLRVEKLPGTRLKIPASIRANYFAGDKLILRTYYRYYQDSWALSAHTLSLEPVLKISPFFSVSPSYRFTHQKGTKYFSPYLENSPNSEFYTSDFDLSSYNSHFLGLGTRISTPGGIFGIKSWRAFEVKYSYYNRTTGLDAHIVSLALQFK